MDERTVIEQPQGKIITCKTSAGNVIAKIVWNSDFKNRRSQSFEKKQAYVDQECIRRMAPETPRRTGVLIKSATLGTRIGSGEINQIAPYARRQYYEHKEKNMWFERMKNRHKEAILKGAQKIE